jgi:ion channel
MQSRELRQLFFAELLSGLKVVWPIMSVLLGVMLALGAGVGLLEHWPLLDGIYFAFVSGLTIGYGDLVPKQPLSRAFAIGIGLTGVLLVGLVVAVGVRALEHASSHQREGDNRSPR